MIYQYWKRHCKFSVYCGLCPSTCSEWLGQFWQFLAVVWLLITTMPPRPSGEYYFLMLSLWFMENEYLFLILVSRESEVPESLKESKRKRVLSIKYWGRYLDPRCQIKVAQFPVPKLAVRPICLKIRRGKRAKAKYPSCQQLDYFHRNLQIPRLKAKLKRIFYKVS